MCFQVRVSYLEAKRMSSTEAKPQIINPHLSFREAVDSPISQSKRPLVFLYGWLVAKSKHIHKYGDFYLGKGFDVLHIKISPRELLWPLSAQAVVEQALEFAIEEKHQQQPVVVHGFSAGAYLYGETLVKISTIDRYKSLAERIQAQILDSPIDFYGVPFGVANAISSNRFLQKACQTSIEAYLSLFKEQVTTHYIRASDQGANNYLKKPCLFMYSKADPTQDFRKVEEVIDRWRKEGIHVEGNRWPDSPHVGHFAKYPVEYILVLNNFLQNVGLISQEEEQRIHLQSKV